MVCDAELYELHQAGKSYADIAASLHLRQESIRGRVSRYRKAHPPPAYFPPSPTPPYTDYLTRETDAALIVSDLEIPDYDTEFLHAAYLLAQKLGIRETVIAGDFLATDQTALNDWATTWVNDREPTFEHVVDMGYQVLRQLLEQTPIVSLCEGNHDFRVAAKTGGQVHLGMFVRGLPGVTYSRYEYLYLKTRRGVAKIIHPVGHGSANSVALGQRLYNVTEYQGQKCDIVIGHTHQPQTGFSPDGLHEIYALGCMRDPLRTRYKMKRATPHHQWVQSFLLVLDGYYYPIYKHTTNWRYWLGDMARELAFAR